MSIKAAIHHVTHYTYDRPVHLGPQVIRLRPAPHSRTRVISHSLKVTPAGHFVNHQQDPYGNWQSRFVFPEPVRELKIEVDLVADMSVYNPFDFFVEEAAETWPFHYPPELRADLEIYRRPESAGPLLQKLLESVPQHEHQRTVDMVVALNAQVAAMVGYIIRMEPGVQTPEQTLLLQRPGCLPVLQHQAHGRDRGTSGRSHSASRAGAPVGAVGTQAATLSRPARPRSPQQCPAHFSGCDRAPPVRQPGCQYPGTHRGGGLHPPVRFRAE